MFSCVCIALQRAIFCGSYEIVPWSVDDVILYFSSLQRDLHGQRKAANKEMHFQADHHNAAI